MARFRELHESSQAATVFGATLELDVADSNVAIAHRDNDGASAGRARGRRGFARYRPRLFLVLDPAPFASAVAGSIATTTASAPLLASEREPKKP